MFWLEKKFGICYISIKVCRSIRKRRLLMFKKCKNNIPTYKRIEFKLRIVEVVTGIIGGVIALVAVILSIIALHQSKEIIDYQVMQESMPKLVILNNRMNIDFEVEDNEISNYEPANNMCISIYNVGMGIAQNCKFIWDENSIITAVERAKEQFRGKVFCIDFDSKNDSWPSLILYDYYFRYENNKLTNIMFYESSSGKVKDVDLNFQPIDTTYLLPVSKEDNKVLIEIPKPISIMLLEYANQNIDTPISINVEIKYEDVMENIHSEIFCVEFSVKQVRYVKNDEFPDKSFLSCEYDVVVSRV